MIHTTSIFVLRLFLIFFILAFQSGPELVDLRSICSGHWRVDNWNLFPINITWSGDGETGTVSVPAAYHGPGMAYFETDDGLSLDISYREYVIEDSGYDNGRRCGRDTPHRHCIGLLGLQPGPFPLDENLPFTVLTQNGDPVPVGSNTAWDGGLDVIFCQDNWIPNMTFTGWVGDERIVTFTTGEQYPTVTIDWLNTERFTDESH